MLAKHGDGFDRDGGWALGYVRSDNFREIEKAANLEMWRPHYHWSSVAVHGGFKGMISDIAQLSFEGSPGLMLAGPSNSGLADPASCTAISLHSCTRTFIKQRPTPESAATIEAMGMIVRTMEDAFVKAQRELDEDERRLQAKSE
jgi:hypothetical protein